jgi:hypothetical protein
MRRFSKREFDRASAISRMEPETIDLVRAVLVEGRSQAVVARERNVGRSWVNMAVGKMLKYIQEANPVPPGWRTDTVTLPIRDWPKVRKLERAARAALSDDEDEKS